MGTRFIATPEATAHPLYKQRLLEAGEEGTERSMLFGWQWPNAAHRVLRTPFLEQWRDQEGRGQQGRPDEPVIGETRVAGQALPVLRFMGLPPSAATRGDVDSMALYAGQGVGLVRDIKPAGEIVRELVAGVRPCRRPLSHHARRRMASMMDGAASGRVELVLVSHSAALAAGLAELVAQVAGPEVAINAIGGGPDGGLGTDGRRVLQALRRAASAGGAVVLMDLGSAVLTVRAALEELEPAERARILAVDAPLVEGAVAAGVTASTGATLEEVARAAREAREAEKL